MWDHQPTPHELLARRLEAGWVPTPSELRDGPAVEGFASCVFIAGKKPADR